jgi:hypothetical protein
LLKVEPDTRNESNTEVCIRSSAIEVSTLISLKEELRNSVQKNGIYIDEESCSRMTFGKKECGDMLSLYYDVTSVGAVFQVSCNFKCLEQSTGREPPCKLSEYRNTFWQGSVMACPGSAFFRRYYAFGGRSLSASDRKFRKEGLLKSFKESVEENFGEKFSLFFNVQETGEVFFPSPVVEELSTQLLVFKDKRDAIEDIKGDYSYISILVLLKCIYLSFVSSTIR